MERAGGLPLPHWAARGPLRPMAARPPGPHQRRSCQPHSDVTKGPRARDCTGSPRPRGRSNPPVLLRDAFKARAASCELPPTGCLSSEPYVECTSYLYRSATALCCLLSLSLFLWLRFFVQVVCSAQPCEYRLACARPNEGATRRSE